MQWNDHILTLPGGSVTVEKRVGDYLSRNPAATLIRLDQKLMNMELPPKVTEAMHDTVREMASPFGKKLESPWSGYDNLKSAVVRRLSEFGVNILESEVLITSGMESAYTDLSLLFGVQNQVLAPDPGDPSLAFLHRAAGRHVGFLRATPENAFLPLPDQESADLIFLSSPNSITGAAYSREALTQWVEFANRTGAVLFYDASLSDYLPEDMPHSIYEIEGAKTCAVELFSFEKGYGVRELKSAYMILPIALSRHGVRIHDLSAALLPNAETPPSFVMQRAAELLFSEEARAETSKMIYRIQKVSALLSRGLADAGIAHAGETTSPYLWAQCPDGMNAWQCFDRLLEEAQLVVTPGSVFGYGGERFFRITAFGHPDEAEEAVRRLSALFGKSEEAEEPEPKATKEPEEAKDLL